MSYNGIARGKMIELEEPLPYADGQRVTILVEPLAGQLRPGSLTSVRKAMHQAPHLSREDVNKLERAIESAKLPVQQAGVFDGGR